MVGGLGECCYPVGGRSLHHPHPAPVGSGWEKAERLGRFFSHRVCFLHAEEVLSTAQGSRRLVGMRRVRFSSFKAETILGSAFSWP